MSFQQVVARLKEDGLLLQTDRALPSVAGIIAGEPVRGSWWGHKRGHEIFRALKLLEAHPDVLPTRLISGKVTYVHRRLWPEFLSLAKSGEPWQTGGISREARELLLLVRRKGKLRTDQAMAPRNPSRETVGEIERRLLLFSDEVHTERGSHAKVLMTWSRCQKLRNFRSPLRKPSDARAAFDRIISTLNARHDARATLPWSALRPGRP